jgi:hypothetical protein
MRDRIGVPRRRSHPPGRGGIQRQRRHQPIRHRVVRQTSAGLQLRDRRLRNTSTPGKLHPRQARLCAQPPHHRTQLAQAIHSDRFYTTAAKASSLRRTARCEPDGPGPPRTAELSGTRNQGGALRRRSPGVSGGLSLGRAARRPPGHTPPAGPHAARDTTKVGSHGRQRDPRVRSPGNCRLLLRRGNQARNLAATMTWRSQ